MGKIASPEPVLLVIAAISRHHAALDWARGQAIERWGPLALESERFDFTETAYYDQTMGAELKKQFLAFQQLVDPALLPQIKLETNALEARYAGLGKHSEPRPLNLDPGYLTPAKLVLVSTKDHSHRVYLAHGIYAEVTLYFRAGRWQPREWTYPDYRRPDFHDFFSRLRGHLLHREDSAR